MKSLSMRFVAPLLVFLSIGIFATYGYSQAADTDKATEEGQKAIMEGAKQMMDGNKTIMDLMEKKGMKDAELTAAEKQMKEGYDMINKGSSMMTGPTMPQGKEMVTHGAKMMLEAQKATAAVVEKKGMTTECSIALDTCTYGEKKIKEGALQWFFGAPGI